MTDTVSRPRHAASLPRRALPAHPVPAAGGWRACRRDRGALSARSDGVSRTPAAPR